MQTRHPEVYAYRFRFRLRRSCGTSTAQNAGCQMVSLGRAVNFRRAAGFCGHTKKYRQVSEGIEQMPEEHTVALFAPCCSLVMRGVYTESDAEGWVQKWRQKRLLKPDGSGSNSMCCDGE